MDTEERLTAHEVMTHNTASSIPNSPTVNLGSVYAKPSG